MIAFDLSFPYPISFYAIDRQHTALEVALVIGPNDGHRNRPKSITRYFSGFTYRHQRFQLAAIDAKRNPLISTKCAIIFPIASRD